MPVNTFRAWFIGFVWSIILPGLNQFFFFRYPSVTVSGVRPRPVPTAQPGVKSDRGRSLALHRLSPSCCPSPSAASGPASSPTSRSLASPSTPAPSPSRSMSSSPSWPTLATSLRTRYVSSRRPRPWIPADASGGSFRLISWRSNVCTTTRSTASAISGCSSRPLSW